MTPVNKYWKSFVAFVVLMHCGTLYAQSKPTIIIDSLNPCYVNGASQGVSINKVEISISQDDDDPEYSDQIILSETIKEYNIN